jgi:O-antigen/teichoic acid export membrane protein
VLSKETLTWKSPATISRSGNVVWNGLARFLQVALQFAFVPVAIHLLGADSYGLVVLSATLMTMLMVLDQFMNAVLMREFGRANGVAREAARLWSLLSGLEAFALVSAALVALSLPFLGPLLTRHWTGSGAVSGSTLQHAFLLMGVMIGAQLPGMLYASGLQGLQRQKLLAVVRIVWTPLYYGGGVVALLLVERSILVLFTWQIIAFAMLAVVLRLLLRKTMPPLNSGESMVPVTLHALWRLGAAAAVLGLSSSIAGQIDKIIVAAAVSPMQFAAYGLAFTVALQAMSAIINIFGSAALPHFAQLLGAREKDGGNAAGADEEALRLVYHRWSQVIAFVSIIGMGFLFLWGGLLVDLWLGRTSPLADGVKALLPLATAAMLLGALTTAPFTLMLAANRVWPIISVNLTGIALAALALPTALKTWGPGAGAAFSILLMAAYCLVSVSLMHRVLLRGSLWRWLIRDFTVPLLVGICLFAGSGWLLPSAPSPALIVLHGVLTATATAVALIAVLPDGRAQILGSIRYFRRTVSST